MLFVGVLSGCGGGGSGGGAVGYDASPFFGDWMNDSEGCISNTTKGTDGTVYSSIERRLSPTETRVALTSDLYQGLTCDNKVGTVTLLSTVKWSDASIVGKQIAARVTIAPIYQQTATLANGTPIPLQANTYGKTTEKTVFAIADGVLYLGNNSDEAVFDKDGYPTTVERYGPKR